MKVCNQIATFLVLGILYFKVSVACDIETVAVFNVTLSGLWSEETFPKDYPVFPLFRPKAQWSRVFGQSHNASYALFRIGKEARKAVRDFAQFDKIENLVAEGDDDPKVYDQFLAPAIDAGVGDTENVVFVDGKHSMVSLMSRLIPSPDWFVGIDSIDLCVDSGWIEQIVLDLEPLDAGAASGLTFTSPRWDTVPPEKITKHNPRQPNHPAAAFYYPDLRELPPIAKVEFIKIKEYSTKELNNFARKEIQPNLLRKRKRSNRTKENKSNEKYQQYEAHTEKPNSEYLRDLEEDPVGTPIPNLPDNNVVVVTKPPTTIVSTESEFGGKIKSMDDVVLAVAHGRMMGLGEHMPRHFRSRLHHAVNKIQPNDCLLSDWSEWTPCSATCGFGEQFRHRKVVREKRKGGRDCPRQLTERQHCGNVNSCTHIDYFEW